VQTTRQEALTTHTGKGQLARKRTPADPSKPLTDGARVYFTLAATDMIPYEPKDHDQVRGGLNAAINITHTFVPIAAHRTRKAFAKLTEILVGRGLLSQEELDEILLAAVDYQEMEPVASEPGRNGR